MPQRASRFCRSQTGTDGTASFQLKDAGSNPMADRND
jgi:hypothetical protein